MMASNETVKFCLALLRPMRPNDWTSGVHDNHYGGVFEKLDDDLAKETAERAADTLPFRPSRAELWDIAAELASPLPTEEDAFGELLRMRADRGMYGKIVGRFPSGQPCRDLGTPEDWSHPILSILVSDMGGWQSICQSDKDDVLRGQFRTAFTNRRTSWRQMVRKWLPVPAGQRPPGLFPVWQARPPRIAWNPNAARTAPLLQPTAPPLRLTEEKRAELKAIATRALPALAKEPPKIDAQPVRRSETRLISAKDVLEPTGGTEAAQMANPEEGLPPDYYRKREQMQLLQAEVREETRRKRAEEFAKLFLHPLEGADDGEEEISPFDGD